MRGEKLSNNILKKCLKRLSGNEGPRKAEYEPSAIDSYSWYSPTDQDLRPQFNVTRNTRHYLLFSRSASGG